MMKKLIAAIVVTSSMVTPAFAEGIYGAFDVGQSKISGACANATALGWTCSETDTGFRAGLGYQVNQNFGVEASYADYGAATITAWGATATYGVTGVVVSAVATLPLSDAFSLIGKVNLVSNTAKAANRSEGTSGAGFGVGVKYNISPTVAVRAMYEDNGPAGGTTLIASKVKWLGVGVTVGF